MTDLSRADVLPAPSAMALVADIGGTNARFALIDASSDEALPVHEKTLPVAAHASLGDAIEAYLCNVVGTDRQARPRRAALALATAITGDAVSMTNSPWSFSAKALQARLGLNQLLLLNDFTALAWSLLSLPQDQFRQVGGGVAVADQARGLIGPGTGLGVSGLIPVPGGGWTALQGEGGHCSLSPADAREAAILGLVWRDHPHVSVERLVCGTGLPVLFKAVAQVDGLRPPAGAPESDKQLPAWISEQALEGEPLCDATMRTFCAMLGTAAGNLALVLGARGGVFIGGGIVPKLGRWFDQTLFRARFEAKGRFRPYLQSIPTFIIEPAEVEPALLGSARALRGTAPGL